MIEAQVYVACGYELTAAVAFPSLAYFQLLRFPLVMLPSTIENCVNGLIALRRLQAFLEARVKPYHGAASAPCCSCRVVAVIAHAVAKLLYSLSMYSARGAFLISKLSMVIATHIG